jgi:hypothetical protein
MRKLLLTLLLSTSVCVSAKTITSDPIHPQVTHCRFFGLPGSPITAPVARNTTGQPYCWLDVTDTAFGAYIVRATAAILNVDGSTRLQSELSAPLTFRSLPAAPANLIVTP